MHDVVDVMVQLLELYGHETRDGVDVGGMGS